MRKLTVINDVRTLVSPVDLRGFEDKYGLKLPGILGYLIEQYEGCNVAEYVYYNPVSKAFYPINQFLYLRKGPGKASIEAVYEGHLEDGKNNLIPFAIDSGGWDYSVSVGDDDFGSVWLNAWTSGEEEPYTCIADNLEGFIGGLLTADEAIRMGY